MLAPLSFWLEYQAAAALTALARLLPLGAIWFIGKGLGRLGYFLGVRRKVVHQNLALAFPEKSKGERKRIAKASYEHFGRNTLEWLHFSGHSGLFLDRFGSIEGREWADKALQEQKGILFITAHLGSWEVAAALTAHYGYPFSVLVGEIHNPLIDALVTKLRESNGFKTVPRGLAARHLIRELKENHMVAIIADQDARRDGVFVPFFGRLASSHQGPAVFQLKTGAPVLLGLSHRQPDGRHCLRYTPWTRPELSGDKEEDIRRITASFTAAIEAEVRTFPEQYFWFHKRWKTRPEGE